ncbi:MAG: TrkA family potassium uptake protein, partial [bacterium]
MTKYNRGLAILLIITISFITISSGLYYLGMNYLEDRPRTIIESLEFVTQTMTTVGYGQDPPWKHQLMYLLSMVIQLAGITIVFLSIPIVVTPWIEERITLRPPDEYSGPLNHIIITEYTDLQETFLSELESNDIPYTLLEHDEQKARNLYNQGYNVVLGDAEEPNELVETRAEDARIAILDGTDQRNAAVALAIEDVVPDLETLAIAGNEDRAVHLKAAGADKVIYPRRQIGQVLGHKALSGLGKTVQFEPEQSDATLEIQEFPILKNSQICNKSVRESQIRRKTGAHIIGLWRRGDFISQINPNQMIRKDDVLVTAGTRSQLRDLEQFVQQKTRSRESANVVIIGFGNEGMAAAEVL